MGLSYLGWEALPALFFPLGSQNLSPTWLVVSGPEGIQHGLAVPGSRRTNLGPCPEAGLAPAKSVNQLVLCLSSEWARSLQSSTYCVLTVAGLRKPEGLRAAT